MKLVIVVDNVKEHETPEQSERRTSSCEGYAEAVRKVMKIAKGGWGWCTATVTAQLKDRNRVVDEETSYLGNCSYISSYDFVANSGYFNQMVSDALRDLAKRHPEHLPVSPPNSVIK